MEEIHMSKLFVSMTVGGALVLAGLCLPATAAPASHDKGVSNGAVLLSAKEDVAARTRRRTVRRYRAVRVYPAPSLSLIHISEPTRRTPISYAVFCLKKKR